MERAAVQAKINREKKKIYIEQLENEREKLQQENRRLLHQNQILTKDKKSLSDEVAYLRRVLRNDSQLSSLLQKIGDSHSVQLSNKFDSQSRTGKRRPPGFGSDSASHVNGAKRQRRESMDSGVSDGGMCLHVDQNNITLEFCRYCAASNY